MGGGGATTIRLLSKCHSTSFGPAFDKRQAENGPGPKKARFLWLWVFSQCKMEMVFGLLKGCNGEWIINIYKLYTVSELYYCR